jgi:hypothetical protein
VIRAFNVDPILITVRQFGESAKIIRSRFAIGTPGSACDSTYLPWWTTNRSQRFSGEVRGNSCI